MAVLIQNQGKKVKRQKRAILPLILAILLLVITGTFLYINEQVGPVLQAMGTNRVAAIANRIIYDTVIEVLEEEGGYEQLIQLDKDENGRVTALVTNVKDVNHLKANIASRVIERLSEKGTGEIRVPIGSLLNNELLAGRGPRVTIRYIPLGSVQAEVSNMFTSAGINQTRHQIILEVSADISILLPGKNTSTSLQVPVLVGETVIVGNVPESYTNVEGDNSSTLEKINNYT